MIIIPSSVKYFVGRKVASVARNMPYRITKKILSMKPLWCNNDSMTKILIMTTQKMFLQSLWSAYSWLINTDMIYSLNLVVDGCVTAEMKEQFYSLFPNGIVESAVGVIKTSSIIFTKDSASFVYQDKYGRKLGVIIDKSLSHNLIYSDDDVLIFRRPLDIVDAVNKLDKIRYNYEYTASYNSFLAKRGIRYGVNIERGFNSGLMCIPKQSLDLELLNDLLENWDEMPPHYYNEQTLMAMLATKFGKEPLDPVKYVTTWKGMWFWESGIEYDGIVGRHYMGTVRHLLYTEGFPRILEKIMSLMQ